MSRTVSPSSPYMRKDASRAITFSYRIVLISSISVRVPRMMLPFWRLLTSAFDFRPSLNELEIVRLPSNKIEEQSQPATELERIFVLHSAFIALGKHFNQ